MKNKQVVFALFAITLLVIAASVTMDIKSRRTMLREGRTRGQIDRLSRLAERHLFSHSAALSELRLQQWMRTFPEEYVHDGWLRPISVKILELDNGHRALKFSSLGQDPLNQEDDLWRIYRIDSDEVSTALTLVDSSLRQIDLQEQRLATGPDTNGNAVP